MADVKCSSAEARAQNWPQETNSPMDIKVIAASAAEEPQPAEEKAILCDATNDGVKERCQQLAKRPNVEHNGNAKRSPGTTTPDTNPEFCISNLLLPA